MIPRIAAISSYLIRSVAASRQIPDAHGGPAQFGHYPCNAPVCARRPIALWDLKKIQQRLRADTFQPIKKVDFAADALKREPPWINRLCRGSFCRFFS